MEDTGVCEGAPRVLAILVAIDGLWRCEIEGSLGALTPEVGGGGGGGKTFSWFIVVLLRGWSLQAPYLVGLAQKVSSFHARDAAPQTT